jgi:ATP phosphoribosyltransferase regulatory subunit HisZ
MTKITRDLLPEEVAERKAIILKLTGLFEKQGYQEIITPTMEDFETLAPGLSAAIAEASYRFFDHTGKQKILRPDITTQIARVVGSKMSEVKGPVRLYYSGDVYRAHNLHIGQSNQFAQIGVELLDVPGKKGEDEIIALATACLKALGLKGCTIEKTDVSSIQKLSPDKKRALLNQDFVSFGRLPEQSELLSMDIDYYTGLYFECFVPELGYILGAGGRYDKLCGVFGKARPAVGFAFDVDKLIEAIGKQRK